MGVKRPKSNKSNKDVYLPMTMPQAAGKKCCLIQIQNNLPMLDLQRPTICQIIENFTRILLNFLDLR